MSAAEEQDVGKTMSAIEQSCDALEVAGSLIVLSSSRTIDGVWVFNGFAERVAAGAAAQDLGSLVSRGLAASAVGVAHPRDWAAFHRESKDKLKAVGVDSFERLHRSARCVHVRRSAGSLSVTPTASGGATGRERGFHELAELAKMVTPESPSLIGDAVRAALERCR